MLQTALIITTYNRSDALSLCLQSVGRQVILPNEIIVADDGSKPETQKVVEEFSETVSVPVKHIWQEDDGFRLAAIRNKAIRNCESDYVIFIDGDIILHRYFISDHFNNKKENSFIVGSRVLLSDQESKNRLQNNNIDFSGNYSATNKLNGIRNNILSRFFSKTDPGIYNVRGCNMSFWKKDLYAVNGFDERYVGWGREDSDIVQRLFNRGKQKIKLKFAAIQYHLHHSEIDRNRLAHNDNLLTETIDSQKLWAEIGLTKTNNE